MLIAVGAYFSQRAGVTLQEAATFLALLASGVVLLGIWFVMRVLQLFARAGFRQPVSHSKTT